MELENFKRKAQALHDIIVELEKLSGLLMKSAIKQDTITGIEVIESIGKYFADLPKAELELFRAYETAQTSDEAKKLFDAEVKLYDSVLIEYNLGKKETSLLTKFTYWTVNMM